MKPFVFLSSGQGYFLDQIDMDTAKKRKNTEANVPYVDAVVDVVGDVGGDPALGGLGAAGEVREHVVGDADHHLDPRPLERAQDAVLGVEQLHPVEAVVLEQPHHRARRQRVAQLRAPVHAHASSRPPHHAQHQHRHSRRLGHAAAAAGDPHLF